MKFRKKNNGISTKCFFVETNKENKLIEQEEIKLFYRKPSRGRRFLNFVKKLFRRKKRYLFVKNSVAPLYGGF